MGVEKGMDGRESRRERTVEVRDEDNDSPTRDRWDGGHDDDMEVDEVEKLRESSKHRSKDRSKSSSRREEKDHTSKDRERSKTIEGTKERDKESSSGHRKEDRDEREKDKSRDKVREKDADRGKEKEREKDVERGRDKERAKEKSKDKDKDREKERDRERDREKEREKHRDRDREKERENERDRGRGRGRDASEREKGRERGRDKEREVDVDLDREKLKERDRGSRKSRDGDNDRGKEDKTKLDIEDAHDYDDNIKRGKVSYEDEDERKTFKLQQSDDGGRPGLQTSISELEERISKMKEERLHKKLEGASEVLAWVNRSRKLEEKRKSEKEKALQLSKIFEEQDNVNQEESDDDMPPKQTAQNLGGVRVLHGLDKVLEGGAVVLTLKDQSILADGDINQEVDMLENVEIGEQKRRDEAYNAAKKKTGIYDDKFNDEPGSEKKILPQYDEPAADEGIILDASGRFSGEAEKKLEELRKRIQGVSTSNRVEDLSSSGKISSDYYTQEEMLQFKKPKKRKSLRKKEKLDLDALEAEAVAAGLGGADLGSRNDKKRQTLREEEERSEAEKRSNAYQAAIAKAEEASKALRQERISSVPTEEDDTRIIGDDDEDLRKSLERARKLALKKQDEAVASGPRMIAQLASSTASESTSDNQNSAPGEPQENKVVFTEMEEFVWGLQLNEEEQKTEGEDVFMEEDEAPIAPDQGNKEENGGWTEIKETEKEERSSLEEEEVAPDETIHEAAVGKGLAGALKLLKDRGSLKETVEWGGRNMDKKKSKLVGIYDDDGQKEIRIERTDEYGRMLTPKEAFRLLSHKFHGKGPGKMKQEKRMRQYHEELKVKQMKNADTPSQSVERMREVQAQLKTPYLVLSGHVKPGQTSDPRSGFATVEKDLPGGLTPMLGDKKVEHFLGLKRKSESGDAASQKKPKT